MRDVKVKTKNGKEYAGPMHEWKPREGYFTLFNDGSFPPRFFLRDCLSATALGVLIKKGVVEDVDLLFRARQEGWSYAKAKPAGKDNGDETVSYEDVTCVREAGKTIVVLIEGDEFLIPKSLVQPGSDLVGPGDKGELIVPSWFAEKEIG